MYTTCMQRLLSSINQGKEKFKNDETVKANCSLWVYVSGVWAWVFNLDDSSFALSRLEVIFPEL